MIQENISLMFAANNEEQICLMYDDALFRLMAIANYNIYRVNDNKKRRKIMGINIEFAYDTIIGCLNRICVTNEIMEIDTMENSAAYNLSILVNLNKDRLIKNALILEDKKISLIT